MTTLWSHHVHGLRLGPANRKVSVSGPTLAKDGPVPIMLVKFEQIFNNTELLGYQLKVLARSTGWRKKRGQSILLQIF